MTRKTGFITLTLIVLLISFVTFYQINVLQVFIVDKGTQFGSVIYEDSIGNESLFSVHWIHSVSLRPVIETYKIEKIIKFLFTK